MPCYHPLKAWRGPRGPSGRLSVVFDESKSLGIPVTLPCGQCIGCRLERSRQWATRIMHENSLHEESCFLTLTYDDEHLPKDLSLNVKHHQDFMKRLRARTGRKLRFFQCGEYGERYGRPHYHSCLFGFSFPDRQLYSVRGGNAIYTSEFLRDVWSFGHAVIGDVTFDSAAYVARYVLKKVTGEPAEQHYRSFDPATGEVLQEGRRQPEYVTMSRKPGIGADWIKQFRSDVYPSDEVIVNGVSCKPPRYYDNCYELEDA